MTAPALSLKLVDLKPTCDQWGITLTELAARAGVNRVNLSQYANGHVVPSLERWGQIEAALGELIRERHEARRQSAGVLGAVRRQVLDAVPGLREDMVFLAQLAVAHGHCSQTWAAHALGLCVEEFLALPDTTEGVAG